MASTILNEDSDSDLNSSPP